MDEKTTCRNCRYLKKQSGVDYCHHLLCQIKCADESTCAYFTGEKSEKKSEEVDMVNRPPHYTGNGIECIDAMQSAFGKEAVISFCQCNAFKYVWRCNKKKDCIEDMEKAKWYLNKAIELLKD